LAISAASFGLRHHIDRVTRAVLEAYGAAGTLGIIETIPSTRPELNDRVFRTSGVTVVAFKAVATGKAALRFVTCLFLRNAGDDLLEIPHALDRSQDLLSARFGIAINRKMKHIERHKWMPSRRLILRATKPGIDMAGCALAVADRDGD
jgi:hypothetical protein